MTDRTYGPSRQHDNLIKYYSTFVSPKTGQAGQAGQDIEYALLLTHIAQCLALCSLSKHVKIRVNAWLDRLEKEQFCRMEKQNRNNYLKLMHLMLECEFMTHPFGNFPN